MPAHVQLVGSASYLQTRARRRLARGTQLLVAGAMMLVVGIGVAELVDPSSFFAGFPVFLGLGGILLGALQMAGAGRDSRSALVEGPAVAALTKACDDTYLLFMHVNLPRSNHAEAILLGPHGALALGFQDATGDVIVRRHDWFTSGANGEERAWPRSPSWIVSRPIRAVQRLALEQALPDVPVSGAVVLVSGTLKEADEPGVAVVPKDRLAAYLQYLREQRNADQEQVERLAETLGALVARP